MKYRIFLAIEIPASAQARIAELTTKLSQVNPDLKHIPSEKLHLTLNFIGPTDSLKLRDVRGQMRSIAAKHSRFSLQLTFLEYFYRKHGPSVLYLMPTAGTEELRDLQNDFSIKLGEMNLPVQSRFDPYITITELPKSDPTTVKQQLDQISQIELEKPITVEVVDICIYQSLVSRAGTKYQIVERLLLRPAPEV